MELFGFFPQGAFPGRGQDEDKENNPQSLVIISRNVLKYPIIDIILPLSTLGEFFLLFYNGFG